MEDHLSSKGLCMVCRERTTSTHAEIGPGQHLYVCDTCLDTAKENFIWICMSCGSVYIRPKKLVLARLRDPGLKRAYAQCEHEQIIQGVDMCIECDPAGVGEYVSTAKCSKNHVH